MPQDGETRQAHGRAGQTLTPFQPGEEFLGFILILLDSNRLYQYQAICWLGEESL